MKKIAYMDHNATTPLDERVLEAMMPYLTDQYGNASSVHGWGQETRYGVEKGRLQVATLAGASEDNLVFTGGGTEALNTVLESVVRRNGPGNCRVVTSAIEHPAVDKYLKRLQADGKAKVTFINPKSNGVVSPTDFEDAIGDETTLVALMYVNNETGALQPVAEVCEITHKRGALMLTDTVQALGKVPLNVATLGVDYACFAAHKLYGPKGIGAIYFRDRSTIEPLFQGGGQEMKVRPGTENVASIAGFGKAAELSGTLMEEEADRLAGWRDNLQERLVKDIGGVHVCAGDVERLPGTLCVCFEGIMGTYFVLDMAEEGVACSSGSACAANKSEPSYVLLAMGMEPELAGGAVRFSLGRATREEHIDIVANTAAKVVENLRKNPPRAEDELDLRSICD